MNYQKMSSIESDFADHPGDGPPGAFIIWLIPILWPLLIVRFLLPIPERSTCPRNPSVPMPGNVCAADSYLWR